MQREISEMINHLSLEYASWNVLEYHNNKHFNISYKNILVYFFGACYILRLMVEKVYIEYLY